jgi:hypothetical protein
VTERTGRPARTAGAAAGSTETAGRRRRGPNAAAIERTIAALRRAERLLEVDAASLALVRSTARALDSAAGAYDVAVVARVHLAAVSSLLAGHTPDQDVELDRFLASLRST